ncbi:MAG TPA: NADH-ubiquinone oxidoreductase-F iron-sulfur binding region domain-containing protein [Candidatus Limnocylindrales bacterium]|nr:NADH-ubiquinone oxidoreductase-F iron-sulfur binding region domain-containing protein [Candidatus Limnocylindrales bacterium]
MVNRLPTPSTWPAILLERADAADPTDLDAAAAAGVFEALRRAIRDLGATGTIATVAASGLRGRGGAGFPTGEKWRAAAAVEAPRRYVVANGYGADPATFTDRALLELDPYAVVEGTAIAAYAIGATEAFIAVRAEQVEAIRRLEAAIANAEEAGFLGMDVHGSGHDIDVRVRPVQGAYMLGEETVLLKALEGRRGQPEQRPPHPTERGLFGLPTVVQNVQTLAAVPWIVRNGPGAFGAIGARESPGTILVQVRGPAAEGIAEVPLGTSLRDIVALAGKLPRAARSFKAVLVGGPSGGLLPRDLLDTPYDFESLRAVGAHVGSGSLVIADDRACVVDLARLLTRFCSSEACGKSIPCRIGTKRLAEIADRMTEGRPRQNDMGILADLSADIVASGLCDHERLATLPLGSAMRYFQAELDAHLLRSSCPAGVCQPIKVAAGRTPKTPVKAS